VVGTPSLICEAEIILMIKDVFSTLKINDYSIKINHRGILSGLAEVIGAAGNETALFVAIDKLDKIGEDKVREELKGRGFTDESLDSLFAILNFSGSNSEIIARLAERFSNSESGKKGLNDLQETFGLVEKYGVDLAHVEFDVALARGLSYYTGCIFEVKINNVGVGSVSGGGRYDNLTQAFGDKDNLSGVGFSFGVDRLFDAMEELALFPKDSLISSKVLLCHLDQQSMEYALGSATKLRAENISCEVYPEIAKMKKQLEYANRKSIPFAVIIGPDEIASGELALKNLETGQQEKISLDQIINKVSRM
jgi:histidyl-tRNA synthetase